GGQLPEGAPPNANLYAPTQGHRADSGSASLLQSNLPNRISLLYSSSADYNRCTCTDGSKMEVRKRPEIVSMIDCCPKPWLTPQSTRWTHLSNRAALFPGSGRTSSQ